MKKEEFVGGVAGRAGATCEMFDNSFIAHISRGFSGEEIRTVAVKELDKSISKLGFGRGRGETAMMVEALGDGKRS